MNSIEQEKTYNFLARNGFTSLESNTRRLEFDGLKNGAFWNVIILHNLTDEEEDTILTKVRKNDTTISHSTCKSFIELKMYLEDILDQIQNN